MFATPPAARPSRVLLAALSFAIVLAACTSGQDPPATSGSTGSPQAPTFSEPTAITNPYLPLAQGGRWVYEGTVGGKPYLVEVALTQETGSAGSQDGPVDTLVVRRREWVKGVLVQEAFEQYAQADDGGVWLFGSDVDRFDKGKLADHEGTWLAGVDGAVPALVLPGDPAVGQVFSSAAAGDPAAAEPREVLSSSQPADTPEGPVDTGLLVATTGPDGATREEVFVPDVGEVLARGDEGEVALTDRLPQDAESATAVTFSAPTTVDNPYFGVTGVDYRLYLGQDQGEPLRIEVAPTGVIRTIDWEGGSTQAVESQFVATSERDLLEIAVDWFAQDDGGNVWYFGEDVFNYERGRVADTHGTWVAGADGPPGLIMPGDPTLGQRFNPENIPGFVFETVDIRALDATYDLPAGATAEGVLALHETLDTGAEENKLYALGYGNVHIDEPGETLDIVYALPNDAIDAPVPAELVALRGALEAISADGTGDADALLSALDTFAGRGDAVPVVLLDLAGEQLDALELELRSGRQIEARMAALDLEQTVLDIARLYRTERPVDLDALDLLARRIEAATDADDRSVAGSAAALAEAIGLRAGLV